MVRIFGVFNRWSAASRVLLFYLVCVVFLMVAAPFGAKFSGQWSKVAIGGITTLATFALTVLFVASLWAGGVPPMP